MIFSDDIVKLGEEGGRKAAGLLHNAILNYIQLECREIPIDVNIVCRIYANVSGLGQVLVRAGIIDDVTVFEEFTRGFTRGKLLFDFVDVGPGKDHADDKISGKPSYFELSQTLRADGIETFKLYQQDFHCRQIFLGCSHDNGYARLLEDHATDDVYVKRVTLLEGVPFEKELLELPYKRKRFPDIFRDAKLNVNAPALLSPQPNGLPKTYNMFNGLPSRFPPPPSRSPSTSTLASFESPRLTPAKPVVANSWAAKAAAPAPPVTVQEQPIYKPVQRNEVIARNRLGQRIDPPCRDYDKAEVDRVKKMKMCNVHFLRHECPFGENCTHSHAHNPTREELNTLRLVARLAPCINGSGCQDVKCIYGHICPAPRSKHPVKGTKTCIFGEQCKFPVELHDIDRNVVKTLVVR
jgi:hypothetical protein